MDQSSLFNNPDELDERRCGAAKSKLILISEEIPPLLKIWGIFLKIIDELELSWTSIRGRSVVPVDVYIKG